MGELKKHSSTDGTGMNVWSTEQWTDIKTYHVNASGKFLPCKYLRRVGVERKKVKKVRSEVIGRQSLTQKDTCFCKSVNVNVGYFG